MLKIKTAKFTANPDASGWVQVHDFIPQEEDKLKKRGHLIAVFALRGVAKLDPAQTTSLGKEVLTRLHEEYYGQAGDPVRAALTQAVKRVTGEFTTEGETLEISAGVLLDDVVYLSSDGGASAYLLRGGQIAKLDNVAGRLYDGDTLILFSSAFGKMFSPDQIRKSGGAFDQFAPVVHGSYGLGSLGAVSITVGDFDTHLVSPELRPKKQNSGLIYGTRAFLLKVIEGTISFLESIKKPFEKVIPRRSIMVGSDTRPLEDQGENKTKRTAVSVGFILLILLGISIVFGVRQSKISAERKQISGTLEEIQHNLAEAKSLAGINTQRARELMMNAKSKAQELKDEGIKDQELDTLIAQITDSMGSVGGIYEESPQLFLDLGLLSSGFNGSEMALSDDRMLVLDTNASKLVSIEVSTKKTQILAGPDDIAGAKKTAVYTTRNFVVSDDEILEIDARGVGLVKKKDWEGDTLLSAYTGNIYVLDKGISKVYRYQGLGGGNFGDKEEWFSSATTPDLGDALSWGIDGAVWVLKKDGIIRKFTLGKQDAFSVTGLDKPISDATDIYVDDETEYLYILDPKNERVVVVAKTGEFKAEYVNSDIANAKRLVVSEKDKKMILLTGNKLEELEIKHL